MRGLAVNITREIGAGLLKVSLGSEKLVFLKGHVWYVKVIAPR